MLEMELMATDRSLSHVHFLDKPERAVSSGTASTAALLQDHTQAGTVTI